MKGKSNFTDDEKKQLREIIKKYENSNSASEKKYMRTKLRKIGFYVSDYGISNITINDFDRLFSKTSYISSINKRSIDETKNDNADVRFIKFDPLFDNPQSIPNEKGNYLILLKDNSDLPITKNEINWKYFQNKKVVYTGISNKSLRSRDFKQHFTGTAGNSTLRKSIGSMFGFKKIPRDKVDNGKTKFNKDDENKLTQWMKNKLELHYFPNETPEKYEQKLIDIFNPPLNLSKNKNTINLEFRKELSQLRKNK